MTKIEAIKLVRMDGYEIETLEERYQEDEDILFYAVKNGYDLDEIENFKIRKKIQKRIDSYEYYLDEIEKNATFYLFELPEALQNDYEFVLNAVQKNGNVLEFISNEKFLSDKHLMFEAMAQDISAARFFNLDLTFDDQVMKEGIRRSFPMALMQKKELAEKFNRAIDHRETGLKGSTRFNDPEEIEGYFVKLVEQNWKNLALGDRRIRSNEKIIQIALSQNSSAIEYVDESVLYKYAHIAAANDAYRYEIENFEII